MIKYRRSAEKRWKVIPDIGFPREINKLRKKASVFLQCFLFCILLSKLYHIIAHPPLGARGAERGAGPRGRSNSSPTLSSVALNQVPSQLVMSSFRRQPPPGRLEKTNTYYCTVALSTSAHTTHLTQISCTRGAPIIYRVLEEHP